MVNDTRTLLLNTDGPAAIAPLEEYVDPTFKAVPLPTYLQKLRATIFGNAPDRRTLLYRARQIMGLLHATPELLDFVFSADSRITYAITDDAWDDAPDNPIAVSSLSPYELGIVGSPPTEGNGGRTTYIWIVSLISTGVLSITSRDGVSVGDLEFSGGLSDPPTVLPGSTLGVRIPQAATAGTMWTIRVFAVPDADLGTIAARLAMIGDPILTSLFGPDPVEPYLTWRNLWESNMPLPYRLGSIALAIVSRTREVRQTGGVANAS